MKKKSRWIVAIGLVLALVLAIAPTQVLADVATVDPDGPYYPAAGGTFTVDIDVAGVADLSGGQFVLLYDESCIEVTWPTMPFLSVSAGDFWTFPTVFSITTTMLGPGQLSVVFYYSAPVPGENGSGTIIEIEFEAVGETCCTSDLDLTTHAPPAPCPLDFCNGLNDSNGNPISCTWSDGEVEVDGPCAPQPPCAPPPTVVSGIAVPGAPGSEEPGAWVPAGFEPCDEFKPCDMLWVWGEGDPCHFCQWYTIWIQPYEEGVHVFNGDVIDPGAVPPGFVPVDVHIDDDLLGRWGPIELWHVDGEYCELWEIVADKNDAGTLLVYDCDWDGLDAACVGEWGFHIYPEGLTIILVSLGLLAVGGYILVVRRRRGAETDLDL